MSIHMPILANLLAAPRRVVAIDDQRSWRAIDLLVAAFHLAEQIARRSESRTVGIMLPTGGAFPAAALAAWMLGRVAVPLNYLLKKDELQYVIDDCGTDIVVTAQGLMDAVGFTPERVRLLLAEQVDYRAVPDLRWPIGAKDDDLAVLLYTSGTSGRPKGVMLTHGNITSNIRQAKRHANFTARDVLLGVLPQFHSFGFTVLTMLPLVVGCRVVYTARFMPPRIVKLLREHRPTALIAIPSMYNALLSVKNAGPDDFRSLRFTVSGGEPLPRAVADEFRERFGVTLDEGYGLTETSPVTHLCLPEHYAPGCVGRAVPGVKVRIVDLDSGADLPPGRDGEIRLAGPNIMRGYYRLPKETAAAFDDRGFFRTGDIGREDEMGRLYITGRLKEMIIVGGENVFPREIEEVLNKHASVKASAVIGVRDEMRGELPWAFVELNEGASFDEPSLRNWCRENLAGYKVPREIRMVEALPRNPTGKIMRRELGKMVAAGG